MEFYTPKLQNTYSFQAHMRQTDQIQGNEIIKSFRAKSFALSTALAVSHKIWYFFIFIHKILKYFLIFVSDFLFTI